MANKKILVVSLIGAKHIITEADLKANPDLADKVKVGDEVELGPDPKSESKITQMEGDLKKITTLKNELGDQVKSLTNELSDVRKRASELHSSNANLQKELDWANEKLESFRSENTAPEVSSKVKVNHAVVLNGKTYSKEQIKNDASIQEVLLDLKSSAVTAIEG